MPDPPKRSAVPGRLSSTNARNPATIPVRMREDRETSSPSSFKSSTDSRRVLENKARGEGRRTDPIGQGFSAKERAVRDDGYDRVEGHGRSGGGSSSVSRFHAARSSPLASKSTREQLSSPAPTSTKERFSTPVPNSTKQGSSRPGSTAAKQERFSPEGKTPSKELSSAITSISKISPSPRTSSAKKGEKSDRRPNGISPSNLVLPKINRQKHGTVGDEVKLVANSFEVIPKPDLKLYRYHVNVSPEPPTARQRKRAFDLFLENAPFLSHLRHDRKVPIAAVDNRSTMITMEKIKPRSDGDDNRYQCQIPYYEEGQERPRGPSINSHTFTVSFWKELDLQEMMKSLSSRAAGSHRDPILQALDIVMAQNSSNPIAFAETAAGKGFFPAFELGKLGGGIAAFRCHKTGVRMAGPRLLLNINPRAASLYQHGLLLELMTDFRKGGKGFDELHEFMKGIRVEITHLKNKKGGLKVGKISGLALSPTLGANARDVHFLWQGEKTSVAKYFQEKYNNTLKFPEEPVVNIGTEKKPTYIPPEQCTVLRGQVARSALDLDQTRRMSGLALQKPDDSEKSITDIARRVLPIGADAQEGSELFGLTIQQSPLEVNSRVLPAPSLQYGNEESFDPDFGSWNMKERKFHTSANINGWTYLSVQDTSKDPLSGKLPSFVGQLQETMGQYGSKASQTWTAHRSLNLQGMTPEKQSADLDVFLKDCRDTKVTKMILVVIPDNRPTLYAIIKFLADVKHGIHTICVEASKVQIKVEKPRYSYSRNLAQKFNTKAGGINQCLRDETLRKFLPDKTMIVGIQVTSPFPKNQANATLSIVGVVANINENCAQWPASVRTQDIREKIADNIKDVLAERLECWKKNNGQLPENILIYRNGVSENQLAVLGKESTSIDAALKSIYPTRNPPKGTIITVYKSHKTRFYPTEGAAGNPTNGTVVDQDITSQTQWDFYLQAHAGNEKSGRLCPTHYVVLRDDMDLTADRVQQLTHNLCYLSARATRAVSIVPPAHYATLVCERARCYVKACSIARKAREAGSGTVGSDERGSEWTRGVHEELRDSMWYI